MVFFSKDNLPRIKDGAYVININDNKSKGAQWVSLIFDRNTAMYFDFFLKSNIFLNVYQTKSKINQSLATYLEQNLMILSCVDLIVLLSYNI